MKVSLPHIKGKESILIFSFLVYIFFGILSQTFFYRYFAGTIYSLILLVCFSLVILYELVTSYNNRKELLLFFLSIFLAILVLFINPYGNADRSFALSFIYIFALRKIKFKKTAYYALYISCFALVLTILCAKAGMIQNYIWTLYGRHREYLGFLYALYPSTLFFNICCLYIYVKKDKIKNLSLLIFFLMDAYLFVKTDARISCLLTAFVLVFSFIKKYCHNFMTAKLFKGLSIISFPTCALISITLTISYSPSATWAKKLDWDFVKRFYLAQQSLVHYGVKPFGQYIEWYGNGLDSSGTLTTHTYNYVDNPYIQLMQHYGIIFSLLLLITITFGIYKITKVNDAYLHFIFTIVAIHCIIDDLSIYLYFNTFWIAICDYLVNYSTKNEKTASKGKI